jgi:hypothetical protein
MESSRVVVTLPVYQPLHESNRMVRLGLGFRNSESKCPEIQSFFTDSVRTYPQIVAPVSRPAVLPASKPPEVVGAGLETCTTAALESGATKFAIYG